MRDDDDDRELPGDLTERQQAALALMRATEDLCEERPIGHPATAPDRIVAALCKLGLSPGEAGTVAQTWGADRA